MSNIRRVAALGFLLVTCVSVLAQERFPALTVRMKDGSDRVLERATISVNSSVGYILGSRDQQFAGVLTTPPIIPPPGVNLEKKLIPWKDMAGLTLGERKQESDKSFYQRGTIEMRDGTNRKCFFGHPATVARCLDTRPRCEGRCRSTNSRLTFPSMRLRSCPSSLPGLPSSLVSGRFR